MRRKLNALVYRGTPDRGLIEEARERASTTGESYKTALEAIREIRKLRVACGLTERVIVARLN